MTTAPSRGFAEAEFATRCARAQEQMRDAELDALLLTTEAQVRYFSGFLSQFWHSPTRPWFLLLPLAGKPVAVIPTIGAAGMRATWIDDIRCWASPAPDDDGVSLLAATIDDLPRRFGRVGLALGIESHLRMPAQDFARVGTALPSIEWVDCALLLHRLMSVKSDAEIAKIRYVCELTSDSFAALPEFAAAGDSERDIVRRMRIDLLERGADHTPYIVAASGPDGYDDIIMGPTDRVPSAGDILIIDTGTVFDGYFCDFDRNFGFDHASDLARRAYAALYEATDAGLAAARPGATTAEVWRAMWRVLEAAGATGNEVGRMGHGLGAQLTEWPSLAAHDRTPLEVGMVITLEPGMSYAPGKMMVHEENILVTDGEAELLSKRAPAELPIVD